MASAFLQRFDLKVVLLGSSKSGKTALLHRYITHDYRDALPSTYDTAFAAKRVELADGGSVALAIWDTAGSPKFAHLSRMFIRGADVVLLCYDVTSRDHWERLKIWVHEAQTRQRGCHIYLVCTKVDLLQPPAQHGQHTQQRQQCSESSSLGEATGSSSAVGSDEEGSPASLAHGLQAVAASEEGGSLGAPSDAGSSHLHSRATSPDSQGREAAATSNTQASSDLAQQGQQVSSGASRNAAGSHPAFSADSYHASQGSQTGSQPPSSTAGSSALPPVPPHCHSTSPAELARSGGRAGPAERPAGHSGPRTVSWDVIEDEWERVTKVSSRRQSQHFEELHHQEEVQQQPQEQQQQQQQQKVQQAGGQQEGRGQHWARAGSPEQAQQAVPDVEVRAFCDSVGAKLFRTSSRTGEGVVAMFQSLAKECCIRTFAPVQSSSAAASLQKGQHKAAEQRPQHSSSSGGDSTTGPPTPASVGYSAARRRSMESSGSLNERGGGGRVVAKEQVRPHRPQPCDQQPLAGSRGRSGSGSRRGNEGWPPQYPVQNHESHGRQEYVIDASSFEAAPALAGHGRCAAQGAPRQQDYAQCYGGQEGGPGPEGVPSLDYNAKGTCKIS